MTEKPSEKSKEFYTVRDLANLFQVTETTVYRLVRRGELPSYRIGRAIRFRANEVEAFLKRCRNDGEGTED
jgi:excisionase family DNA binding protein